MKDPWGTTYQGSFGTVNVNLGKGSFSANANADSNDLFAFKTGSVKFWAAVGPINVD